MARQVTRNQNEDGHFPELRNGEVLPAASIDLRLNYAFYQLGKMIELRTKGKCLGCMEPHSGEETEGTNIDAKARHTYILVYIEMSAVEGASGH